jgi:hypothetical protein
MNIKFDAISITKLMNELYFYEFSCFYSNVIEDSVVGYDCKSLGSQFLTFARKVQPSKCWK